jgi:hypothetical protein
MKNKFCNLLKAIMPFFISIMLKGFLITSFLFFGIRTGYSQACSSPGPTLWLTEVLKPVQVHVLRLPGQTLNILITPLTILPLVAVPGQG